MKRALTLRRETLTELTTEDLRIAVGGFASGKTCPLSDCVDDLSEKLGCVGTYQCPTYTC